MTSYGFAPGGTSYEVAAAEYVSRRANTTLVSHSSAEPRTALTTLQQFIAEVGTAKQTTLPVDDLLVVSHGFHVGAMDLALDHPGTPDAPDRTADTFEAVDAAATAGTIRIPPALRDPRPMSGQLPIPCVVRFVGCFAGRFDPYVRRLRAAFGEGSLGVEAPLGWDGVYIRADGTRILKGSLRYMLYDFRVGTPDALGTRADLLAALAAKPYQRIDGSVVPTAIWDAAVPRRFDTRGRQKISSTVSLVPPVESLKTIPLAGLYDYHDEWVGPFLLAGGPGPASPAAAIRTFVESELAKWPQFKPDHPLPIHKRLDFPTLSGFVQGFNWQRSPGAPDAHGREGWQGSRHMYMCGVPIVDPGNTRNELVHDYLSANGAIRHMALSNNPNLFARVFTS